MIKYKRVLLKISGESLLKNDEKFFINTKLLMQYAKDIQEIVNMKVQVAIVIGGGNIFRGLYSSDFGINRIQGDYIGILSTIINGIALQSFLEKIGVKSRVQTAIKMDKISEYYINNKAIKYLEKGTVIILSGGTGNIYFTTDTAAVLRAIEINANIILKGTCVNGIYNLDPKKYIHAKKLNNISFQDVYNMRIKVMDMTAFTLSEENKIPILVFNITKPGNLKKIISGEQIGTMVS